MQGKQVVRWVALVALLALVLAATASGTGATPLAQEPEGGEITAIACGDSAVCATAGSAIYVRNNGTGEAIYGENITAGSGTGVRGRGNPGVYGSSQFAAGVRGVSYNAKGVKGESTNNDGVYALSTNGWALNAQSQYGDAVHASSYDLNGVFGISTGAGAADNGVYGETNSTYQYEAGVLGYSTNVATGVLGRSATGWGGYFQADVNSNPDLVLGGTSSTDEDGNLWSHPSYAGSDLLFYSNDEVHVHLDENNDEGGSLVVYNGANNAVFRVDETTGWYGDETDNESDTVIRTNDNLWLHLNDDNSGTLGAVDIVNAADTICIILSDDGNIYKYCGGTSSAVIETSDNVPRRLYVMESPEVWLEDFGFGKLAGGAATVNIEALFLSTINTTDVAYHVFVTPLGDCNGLYVTNKTATSFEVRELGGGTSEIEFEYRIIAKRLGWEHARMEPAPVDSQGNPVPASEVDDEFASEPIIIEVSESEE